LTALHGTIQREIAEEEGVDELKTASIGLSIDESVQ